MIEELLSLPVAAVEAFRVPRHPSLFPEEEAFATTMATARRVKFATVRACARQGMGRLGIAPAPILRGAAGEPLWPAGLTGSMTHTVGYHAAAVARSHGVLAIGLDAEPNEPLRHGGMLSLVSVEAERSWVAALQAQQPEVSWDRLLFSAKECVYKACYPLVGRLGFGDALITVDPVARSFHARVKLPGPSGGSSRAIGLSGRWLARSGLIVTALVLRRPRRGQFAPARPGLSGSA